VGRGEFKNGGLECLEPRKRAQKNFEKINFENFEEKNVFGNTYVVSRCRGGVWYILLRNVKRERQRHVVSSAP